MGIFDFFKSKETIQAQDVTKRPQRRPKETDQTESYTINYELTSGIYHNTYPGFKLSGGLAFTPIAVPVWFMGLPVPEPEDENDDESREELQRMVQEFSLDINQIKLQSSRDGTIWVWPKWSSKSNKLVWEFILDDSVCDIIKDIETGEIIKIITDENIKVTVGYNQTAFVRRIRHFTKSRIDVNWLSGKSSVPNELKDQSMRNPLGILPINFSNNAECNEIRGHSDYERIIPDLKDYHDIDLKRSSMLTKYEPKMVQTVVDVDKWLYNNGYDEITDIDISKIDVILNLSQNETTSFEFPERAHEAYTETLKQKFKKMVEASGIPEIVWGLKTEGNNASVEESMASLVMYVHDKQEQRTEPFTKLFYDSLRILNYIKFRKDDVKVKVSWNDLDSLSDQTKAIIFEKFANGVAALINSAGFTKEQLHSLWEMMYPRATTTKFEDFEKALSKMAKHTQFKNESYFNVMDVEAPE